MNAFHKSELVIFVVACLATVACVVGLTVALALRGDWPLVFLVGTLVFGAIALACVGIEP